MSDQETPRVGEVKEPAPIPERVGEYKVERLLGEGGMGRVFLCRDESLDRFVAVKVLHDQVAAEKDMTERFLREARAMAKVSSPHVVTVFHVVQRDGVVPHIVMEVLEGEDVASRVARDGHMPWREAVDVTLGAVKGLLAAARVGIVHRDVKPANLFLTPHGTKLTDFGLARPVDGSADLTQAGIVVGTPHYLAPELARGQAGTLQSDVYALGATLFRMLTGKPPFDDEAAIAVITKHIMEPVPLVSSYGVEVPKALEELVVRTMAKQPAERPQSWEELEAQLLAVREGRPLPTITAITGVPAPSVTQPSAVRADAPTQVTPSRAIEMKRPPKYAALVAAAVALGAVVLFFAAGGDDDMARIDEGSAAEVLAEIERAEAKERPGHDELVRGHALEKLERDTEAIAAFHAAAKKGASDERALDFLLAMLDDPKADDVIAALRDWPDAAVDDALKKRLKAAWYVRHHAASALEARDKLTQADEEKLGLLDLAEGDTCDRRRAGLVRLRRVGKGDAVLTAVQRASRRIPENLCMTLEFQGALGEIKRRSGE